MTKKKITDEKGFALTFDAMIGVFLLLIVMIFIGGQRFDVGSSQILVQKNLADDLVELSIDMGVVQDYNSIDVNAFFEETLPKNYQYKMTIDTFTGTEGTLVAGPSYTFGDDFTDVDTAEYIESRSAFLSFPGSQSADIQRYNMVKLKLWVRSSVRQREQ